MKEATFTVKFAKIVRGNSPMFPQRQYNGNTFVTHSDEYMRLLIGAYDESGKLKLFYTPTVHGCVTSGFINCKLVHSNNNGTQNPWIEVKKGEMTSHHGLPMFDGSDKCPNVAIDSHDEFSSKVKPGEIIHLRFREDEYGRMSHIKLQSR